MLGIARYTDYAARLVLHLASVDGQRAVPIAEIAEAKRLPEPYVRRLVGKLVAAGILATERGVFGGVRLARPASQISLLDVVEAMEGGVYMNQCLEEGHACPLSPGCPVQAAWSAITDNLRRQLAAATFDVLAERPGHREAHRTAVSKKSPRKPERRLA